MAIGFGNFPFGISPELLRSIQEAARHMDALRAMGGLTAFTHIDDRVRQAAELALHQQQLVANLAVSPAILKTADDQRRMITHMREFALPLQKMMEETNRTFAPLFGSIEMAQTAAINAFGASLRRPVIPPDHLLSALSVPFDELIEAEPADVPERVASIEEILKERVHTSSTTNTNALAWAGIILGIILFLIARAENAAMNEENSAFLHSELEEMEKRLIVEIRKTAPAEIRSEISLFVVQRNAVVKAAPRDRSRKTGTAYADQLVSSSTETGRWIRIDYLDIDRGKGKTGWVLKKYMKRVPRE